MHVQIEFLAVEKFVFYHSFLAMQLLLKFLCHQANRHKVLTGNQTVTRFYIAPQLLTFFYLAQKTGQENPQYFVSLPQENNKMNNDSI